MPKSYTYGQYWSMKEKEMNQKIGDFTKKLVKKAVKEAKSFQPA
jgi:hypothetical protein